MTTFKTFWSVVRKYIGVISLYTTLLIVFGGLNMSTNENQIDFVNSKPNVVIVNNDDYNKFCSENGLVNFSGKELRAERYRLIKKYMKLKYNTDI